jgi:hypothetical protein
LSSNLIPIILLSALSAVVTVAILVFWQWWRLVNATTRRAVVREAARWAVLAAEYLHDQPRSGPTKLTWVLAHLRQRFPDLNEALLTRQAERAVRMIHAGEAADSAARLNGKGPRYVE